MPVIEYHLYRIKFIKPSQMTLFYSDVSPSDLFSMALNEKPTITLKKDNVWHIGNIEYFDKFCGAFAIGRTTKTTVERYDNNTGNFIEQLDDSCPYTYVLFDRSIGVLGVAKKTKVAPDVQAIARKIEGIFDNSTSVKERGINVLVDIIPDPEDFIEKIRSAYSIKRFKAFFTGPNPIDADEIFQKPLSIYCQNLNGNYGSVEIVGDALNEEGVEAVAKSTAATGNTASARIQTDKEKKLISVQLRGDAVRVPVDQSSGREQALREVKEAYYRVRG
ncbi:hypothetical protein [Thiothrix nivea]|uniref:Uncharacterized protein n=1 Tax=Thiothrix nivea (strain ATCC 35100 / DSM 5205 / JP2) TaxID=870187 RepID=A0A656HGF9_THINJ|nr:hypothetical protein [Thiothrix nivea]EIJ35292.1 hypothetical protein Thini_2755 [Thiothrix nivea DSM 5205]